MPEGRAIKSKAQQRFLFAKEARGELKRGTALKMARETKNLRRLPERVKRRKTERRTDRRSR
jgi:hypothetical protein